MRRRRSLFGLRHRSSGGATGRLWAIFSRMHRTALLLMAAAACFASRSFSTVLAETPMAEAPSAPAALDLTPYRGKVVYLDFWASWCGPCRLSFPFMNRLRASFPPGELVVIAVNVDRDPARARLFLRENPANFTLFFDSSGKTASRFNVVDMPTTVLIGRDGRTRYVHKGFYEKNEPIYRQHIAELLRER